MTCGPKACSGRAPAWRATWADSSNNSAAARNSSAEGTGTDLPYTLHPRTAGETCQPTLMPEFMVSSSIARCFSTAACMDVDDCDAFDNAPLNDC